MGNDVITPMLESAVKAPSIHNTQPWRFRVKGSTVDLFADRTRAVPTVDPTGRQLVLSCGAALEFLCIAARALGREPVVRLLPRAGDRDFLARVDVSEHGSPSAEDQELVAAMAKRRTTRHAFERRQVSHEHIEEMAGAAADAGGWAAFLSRSDDVLVTAVLLTHADEAERENPAYLAELGSWRKETGDDGIPASALAPTWGRRTSLALRDFRAADDVAPEDLEVDASGTGDEYAKLTVIGTEADEPRDWIVAGRALARLWLRATALGLVASPMTQVLDSEPYRGWLRRALRLQGYPQMLLRLGYGTPSAPTPRRPVADVAIAESRSLSEGS